MKERWEEKEREREWREIGRVGEIESEEKGTYNKRKKCRGVVVEK